MRVFALVAGMMLLAVGLLVASSWAHCDTQLGRNAAKDAIEGFASASSRGTLHVGAVDEIGVDRIVLRDYALDAPNGQRVTETKRIVGNPDLRALWDGEIRIADCRFEEGTVWLTPGPGGQINLVYASEVPDDRSAMPVILDGIRLVDNTLIVDLPGKPRLRMTGIQGLAHLEVAHQYLWRLDQTSGSADLPIVGATPFHGMHGRLKSDHAHPLIVEMAVDVRLAEPVVNLDYHVPAIGGEEGEPDFEMKFPDGLFAGGDRDADDADDGPPAGGGTRSAESAERSGGADRDADSDEDIEEDADERAEEAAER